MNQIISLDKNVLLALDFFVKNKPLSLNINRFDFPFVVGSGNTYNTGLIIFSKIADKVYVFRSIDEPYTYNVSTYMGDDTIKN